MSAFKEINPKEIVESPFKLIGDDWALVTAGDREKFNTMTISWGGVGIMWGKPVVIHLYSSAEIYICVYGERRPLYNELF